MKWPRGFKLDLRRLVFALLGVPASIPARPGLSGVPLSSSLASLDEDDQHVRPAFFLPGTTLRQIGLENE